MSNDDETRLLKSIASIILESIWITEFYNDASPYIRFLDPSTQNIPRDEEEIRKIEDLLIQEKNDILDELVEVLKLNNYTKIDIISEQLSDVRTLLDQKFKGYRRILWDVIKSEFTTK